MPATLFNLTLRKEQEEGGEKKREPFEPNMERVSRKQQEERERKGRKTIQTERKAANCEGRGKYANNNGRTIKEIEREHGAGSGSTKRWNENRGRTCESGMKNEERKEKRNQRERTKTENECCLVVPQKAAGMATS